MDSFAKGPIRPPGLVPLPFVLVVSVVAMTGLKNGVGLRASLAVRALKITNSTSRLLRRGTGTVAGGRVGLALDPQLLGKLLRGRDLVLVSGTNGKTTTTAMIRTALGGLTASNDSGSNMAPGIVAALARSSATSAIIELDEPWLAKILRAASSASSVRVVLLNLSRDQLDRASEVRQLAERWRLALSEHVTGPPLTVIANVNDPLVAYVVEGLANVVAVAVPLSWRDDAVSCPRCTKPLTFEAQFRCACHDQIVLCETWRCDCGFVRPTPKYMWNEGFHGPNGTVPFTLSMPGRFNESNAVMALAVASQFDVDVSAAAQRVGALANVAGRFAVRQRASRQWRVMLAKNPAGFAALFEAVNTSTNDLVIEINDNVADGHDPSWLYDAPFELLRGRRVYCFGTRALDLATRLEYAEVAFEILDDLATPRGPEPIDVIANYTAFAQWQKVSTPC